MRGLEKKGAIPPPVFEKPPENQTPPAPKYYVSYAWGDDKTPEGLARDAAVEQLCAKASAEGITILRDKDRLKRGDSIEDFMRAIGTGKHIYIILSEKYLQSVYCMFELSEIWRNARLDEKLFHKRTQIIALPGTRIFDVEDPIFWTKHWERKYAELSAERDDIRGPYGNALLDKLSFYRHIGEILGSITGRVLAKDIDELRFD